MTDTQETLEEIRDSINNLLKLKALDHVDEEASNKEKVEFLYRMDFDTGEMAEIIGTSRASIRSTLSTLRDDDIID